MKPPPLCLQQLQAEFDHLSSLCLYAWSSYAVAQGIDRLSQVVEIALQSVPAGQGVVSSREARSACAAMHEFCAPEWRERDLLAAIGQLRERVICTLATSALEPAA